VIAELERAAALLRAGEAQDALNGLIAVDPDSLDQRDRTAVWATRAVCLALLGRWEAAAESATKLPDQSDPLRLIRCRIAFELDDLDQAADHFARLEEIDEAQSAWLGFCLAIAQKLEAQDPDSRFPTVDRIARLVGGGAQIRRKGRNSSVGRALARFVSDVPAVVLLQAISRIRDISEIVAKQPAVAIDALTDLSLLLKRLRPHGQRLSRLLLLQASLLEDAMGRNELAAERRQELFAQSAKPDELLLWAELMQRSKARPDEILSLLRQAHEAQSSDSPSLLPSAAAALAAALNSFGRTIESRRLLHGYLEAGVRDPTLDELLRRALTSAAYETRPRSPFDAIPEELPSYQPELGREPLSVLFVHAQRFFQSQDKGSKSVLDAAKNLKLALKKQDNEGAARAEAELAKQLASKGALP